MKHLFSIALSTEGEIVIPAIMLFAPCSMLHTLFSSSLDRIARRAKWHGRLALEKMRAMRAILPG